MHHKNAVYTHLMWLLPVCFFAYQFVLRLMPGLIIDDIMHKFHISAAEFGWISSLYYWGYAGMQIPVAILLEKYPPRYIIGTSAIVTASAHMLFIHSDTWIGAQIGRFLIGAGSAVGFLGTSKVIMQWMPEKRYGLYVGLTFSIGLLGAIYGGKPMAYLIGQYDWVTALEFISLIGFMIAILIYAFLSTPKYSESQPPAFKISSLKSVLTNPALWLLACANLLLVGPLEGFADVWSVNYLIKAFEWSKATAAGVNSYVYIGMLFGGPVLAYVATILSSNAKTIIISSFVMTAVLVTIVCQPDAMTAMRLKCLLFILGIACCYQVLIFVLGRALVNQQSQGVALAFLNCMNMLGGAFYHSAIGCAIHNSAQSGLDYTLIDYQYALLIIPIGCAIGGIGVYLLGRIKTLP